MNNDTIVKNANSAINNCLSDKQLNKVLDTTCDFIYKVLSEHCGPCSEYAFIKDVTQALDDGNFTKDGINIVRSLSFYAPIQTALKNAIAHIGSSIERAAADGTTSSMMISIEALKALRKNKHIRKLSTSELNAAWKKLEADINNYYAGKINQNTSIYRNCKNQEEMQNIALENTVVLDMFSIYQFLDIPEDKIIELIAYSQTYTSSHGDKELASTVAKLFKTVPKDAWSTIIVQRADYETDTMYSIEYDKSQWSFAKFALYPFTERLSENIDGVLRREKQKCVLSQVPPLMGGDPVAVEFLNRIINSIVSNEDITYIMPNKSDSMTRGKLSNLYSENPNSKTTLVFVSPEEDGVQNDIEYLPLLIDGYNGEDFVDLELDYETNGKYFKITKGIYNFPELDLTKKCIMHPWIGDDAHAKYNEFVNYLDNGIKSIQKQFEISEVNKRWYEHLKRMKNKLTIINKVKFIIGGSLYNNLTAVDIIHDTLPAVRRSLENGFCLGGNRSLYKALYLITKNNTFIDETTKILCEIFMTAIENMNKAVRKNSNTKKVTFNADDCADIMSNESGNLFYCYEHNIPIVIQPIETDLELVKRFGEMMIKFVKTNKMITVGTMIEK